MTLDTSDTETEDQIVAELESALARAPLPVITRPVEPVLVAVDFKRGKGRCVMHVDARTLHAYLDRLGVRYDNDSGCYESPPRGNGTRVIDIHSGVLSPKVLLRRPAPGATHTEWDLAEHYRVPPVVSTLEAIEVREVVDLIVDHYRPIEISIRVHAKGGK